MVIGAALIMCTTHWELICYYILKVYVRRKKGEKQRNAIQIQHCAELDFFIDSFLQHFHFSVLRTVQYSNHFYLLTIIFGLLSDQHLTH